MGVRLCYHLYNILGAQGIIRIGLMSTHDTSHEPPVLLVHTLVRFFTHKFTLRNCLPSVFGKCNISMNICVPSKIKERHYAYSLRVGEKLYKTYR